MITLKGNFWCEVVSTASKLDTMMVRHMGGKPPYYMLFKEHPKYRKYLRIFEETAVVANHERKSTRTKLNKEEKWQCLLNIPMISLVHQPWATNNR